MKIAKNSTAILIFIALGLCPLIMGGLFFWAAAHSTLTTCTRLETTHIDCQIEWFFLGGIQTDEVTLTRVVDTELVTNCDDGSCTYAINLLTEDGDFFPMTGLSTSDADGVSAEKEQIDAFLVDTTAPSFTTHISPSWTGMLITLPFIALGVLIITFGIRGVFSSQSSAKGQD